MAGAPVPSGPPRTWLGGNLDEFRRDRLAFLTRCARQFGDVVALRLAHRRVNLVSHPDLIEDVVVGQARHFRKHFALRLNPLVLGQGLLTSEGDFWLKQRRLAQPVFQRGRIAGYAPIMTACARRVVASWRAGEEREVLTEMMRLTLAIAAKTLFDTEVGSEAEVVVEALQVLQDNFLARFNSLVPPPVWLPTPANLRLRRAVRRLDAIVYRFIAQRRAQPSERSDLLSLLLRARDDGDGSGMTDRQVRDEAMTLFLAGHETTALTLAWTWYLLAQSPEIEARLHAEIDEVLGSREATVDDVAQLRYTEMVVLEAMRLYPPAYTIGREALVDCVVGGYDVPRGTTLLMSQWVVQRDPRFFAEAEQFRPERWGEAASKQLPRFAYFPFGGGPRLCIGNTFAMMELVLVLATIAQHVHFRMPPGHHVIPQPTFTLRPYPGIPGIIVPRAAPPR
jgi:cytochrome P450